MNSILKRLGKVCLGLGVMLVPVLGFGQFAQGQDGGFTPDPMGNADKKQNALNEFSQKLYDRGDIDSNTIQAWTDAHSTKIYSKAQKRVDQLSNPDNVMKAYEAGAFTNTDGTVDKKGLAKAIVAQTRFLKSDRDDVRNARKSMRENRFVKPGKVKLIRKAKPFRTK